MAETSPNFNASFLFNLIQRLYRKIRSDMGWITRTDNAPMTDLTIRLHYRDQNGKVFEDARWRINLSLGGNFSDD